MTVEEESGELIFQEREIDYAQLYVHLRQLVDCYNFALAYINRLNRFTGIIQEISIPVDQQENRDLIDNKLATAPALKKKLMIIRFLVRWHAEAHIRSKLLPISRNRRLLIERLNVSSDEDSDSIKLFVYLENLERYAQDLIHWGRIKSTILKVIGFLTIAIPILTLFIPQLRPFEGISDPKFLGTMIVELLRIDKSKAFEVILGLNILYAIAVVLYFAFIECGFNVKRAVFAGGLVSEKSDGRDKIKMTFLKRIPYHNVYHIENKVFDLLGVTKPKEFPIDLVINLYVILCLWGLALFSYLSQWGLNSRNDLLVFFVALVVVGIFALLNFFIHRSLRMEKGDM